MAFLAQSQRNVLAFYADVLTTTVLNHDVQKINVKHIIFLSV